MGTELKYWNVLPASTQGSVIYALRAEHLRPSCFFRVLTQADGTMVVNQDALPANPILPIEALLELAHAIEQTREE